MRLLTVQPGASYSTADVYDGLVPALRALGHVIVEYALDGRIARAGGFLRYCYRQARRSGRTDFEPPTAADVLYLAGQGIVERALRHQVDAVLIVSGMYVLPDTLQLLRRAGIPVGLLFTESPYDDARQVRWAAEADVCWTNEQSSGTLLREACPHTHYLPHAYSTPPTLPDAEAAALPAHDVVFVGTGFQERVDTLAAVDWAGLGIDLGLYGEWSLLGPRHRLRQYVRGGTVPNAVAHALYRRAKVGLNLYRTSIGFGKHAPRIAHAASLNPRALELAACGVFTLSDERAEVAGTFGHLVPTFRDAEELTVLLRRWLPDEAGRAAVAERLPACVASATYAARAAQVAAQLAAVFEESPMPCGPVRAAARALTPALVPA